MGIKDKKSTSERHKVRCTGKRKTPELVFDKFLELYASGGNVEESCAEAGMGPDTMYRRKHSDKAFNRRVIDAAKKQRKLKPHKGRRTKLTEKLEGKLLELVSKNGGIIGHACRDLNISRVALYDWKKQDREFTKRFEDAVDRGMDVLEDEAKHRALEGTLEPVFYQGEICGYIRRKSDTMMTLLLKAHRNKYRDRQELSGPDGQPLSSKIHIILPDNGRPDKPPIIEQDNKFIDRETKK